MDKKKANRISILMEIVISMILWAFGGSIALQAYGQGNIAVVGIVIGVNVWMTYGLIKGVKKRMSTPQEEAYERYCAQIVNGQMTEYPTVVRLGCFKSIPAAMEWGKMKEESQSYRIVDLADGFVVVVNGTHIEKKLREKDRIPPPAPHY